jgi:hypothetical protein
LILISNKQKGKAIGNHRTTPTRAAMVAAMYRLQIRSGQDLP